MSVSVQSLISQVRLMTDRVNDPTLLDATIAQYLADGARSLYDIFIDAFPHWFQSSLDFTLTGNTSDTATVALPADFQVDLGLDWLDAPGMPVPVLIKRLPTFQDRNRYIPGAGLAAAAGLSRNYEAQGSVLRVYPPTNSAGSYRLWYQRQLEELQLPTTVTGAIAASDTPIDFGGSLAFSLANIVTDAAMVGGTITVAFASPNASFSVTGALIAAIPGGSGNHLFVTSLPMPGGSFSGPAGGTFSITYQPAVTRSDLPQVLTPWQLYLKTFAALTVRISFEEDIRELQARMTQETARATKMAQKRDSDIRQIPILGSYGVGIDMPGFDTTPFGGYDY